MPKYYGCPCEGCGRAAHPQDDIVVCPDCGAPYHRDCYEKLGRCIHTPAHGAGYEWKFPYKDAELRTCPSLRRAHPAQRAEPAAAAVPCCRQEDGRRSPPTAGLPQNERGQL